MRFSALFLFVPLLLGEVGLAQTIDIKSSTTSALPTYRPALLGTGPTSLINRIDTQDLIKKGQKDAAIMFTCTVRKTGEIAWSGTYRGTPDSKLLEDELQRKLADAKFVPGVYNHLPVDAIFYGTVMFAVVDGKPRLRIFSNQEMEELEKESDFVGPQPFFGYESQFNGWHYPSRKDAPVEVDGAVEVGVEVSEKGFVNKVMIGKEEPPFLGFGDAALIDISRARFIPAFRDGKPVACHVVLPVFFKRKDDIFSIPSDPSK
jgi:hypothetical protein